MAAMPSTALVLGALSAPEWRCLHDLALPAKGRTPGPQAGVLPETSPDSQRVTVPHVAVGPGGIFFIDTCDWSGAVWLEEGRLFREVDPPAYGEALLPLTTPLAGGETGQWHVQDGDEVVARAESLAARGRDVLPGHLSEHVRAVLCLTRSDRVRGRAGDVVVCATLTLPFLLQSRPPVLPPDGVEEAFALLGAAAGVTADGAADAGGEAGRAAVTRSQADQGAAAGADTAAAVTRSPANREGAAGADTAAEEPALRSQAAHGRGRAVGERDRRGQASSGPASRRPRRPRRPRSARRQPAPKRRGRRRHSRFSLALQVSALAVVVTVLVR
jgi:hypothetical protein